jgi:transcriptional regulator with GAF, ATPase, and Fis domain
MEFKKALDELSELKRKLDDENMYLRGISEPKAIQQSIITRSPSMILVIEKIRDIKDSSSPVIIIGEPCSGKKFLASIIHKLSERKDQGQSWCS